MKEVLFTESAPKPIGPYSQAVRVGNLVFCSGQIAIDPAVGDVVHEGNVERQTEVVMENVRAVLEKAAGLTLNHVVKTTIFLKSMDDFPKVNAIYGRYFEGDPPARSTVEVSRLPKNVLVEIEVIASVS